MEQDIAVITKQLQQIYDKKNFPQYWQDVNYDPEGMYKMLVSKTCEAFYGTDISQLNIQAQTPYKEQMCKNGFVTHGFNGYFTKSIKTNGFAGNAVQDPEINRRVNFLESHLGKQNYVGEEYDLVKKIYVAVPSEQTVQYSVMQTMERLQNGPFNNTGKHSALPIKLQPKAGESKKDYYMRIITPKINDIGDAALRAQLFNSAQFVTDRLFTQMPAFAVIPVSQIKNNLVQNGGAFRKTHIKMNESTWADYMDNFFAGDISYSGKDGVNNDNNIISIGNMVVKNPNIPPKSIGIVSVPDWYDICQLREKMLGTERGQEFKYKYFKNETLVKMIAEYRQAQDEKDRI